MEETQLACAREAHGARNDRSPGAPPLKIGDDRGNQRAPIVTFRELLVRSRTGVAEVARVGNPSERAGREAEIPRFLAIVSTFLADMSTDLGRDRSLR